MKEPFSKRNGFSNVEEVEITVRNDAPEELRGYFIELCYECGLGPKDVRSILCRALKKQPNQNNWSDYPNVDGENCDLIQSCKWYKVYDIIERVLDQLKSQRSEKHAHFYNELNDYFVENGIGWKLAGDIVEIRGPESFEIIVKTARDTEQKAGNITASKELHQAISDLSRRPDSDPTGAIQHAMASLECVAREITGDVKANLGDIMKRHGTIIPAPLDQAVIKAWGYASEHGRHIREGREPTFADAELIVGLSASLGNYLIKVAKSDPQKQESVDDWNVF